MITLIALTLAFANPTAAGEAPPTDTCPEELNAANKRNGELTTRLEECEQKLEAAKATTPKTAPAVRVAPKAKPQPAPAPAADDTNPPPTDLRPGDDEDAEDEEIDHLFDSPPPVAAPNNYVLVAPNPGPLVMQVAIDFPQERRTRAPKVCHQPKDTDEDEVPENSTPAPVSTGNARAEFLVGVMGGVSYAGESIKSADHTVVGGGLEVPLSASAGFLLTEKNGLVIGGLLHGGAEPVSQGSNAGFDFLLGGSLGWAQVMVGFGPSFTAYQSWDGQMGASLEGGEAKLIGLVPLGDARFGADIFLAAGAKGGALMTSDSAQLGWGVHPSLEGGVTIHFATKRVTESEE